MNNEHRCIICYSTELTENELKLRCKCKTIKYHDECFYEYYIQLNKDYCMTCKTNFIIDGFVNVVYRQLKNSILDFYKEENKYYNIIISSVRISPFIAIWGGFSIAKKTFIV